MDTKNFTLNILHSLNGMSLQVVLTGFGLDCVDKTYVGRLGPALHGPHLCWLRPPCVDVDRR